MCTQIAVHIPVLGQFHKTSLIKLNFDMRFMKYVEDVENWLQWITKHLDKNQPINTQLQKSYLESAWNKKLLLGRHNAYGDFIHIVCLASGKNPINF